MIDSFKSNVVGNIHLFNLYLPLILKGRVKKVVAISSGMAHHEITLQYGLDLNAPYEISKAAMNTAVAKSNTQYSKDGVLFFSVCPGSVYTGHYNDRKKHVPLQTRWRSDNSAVTPYQMQVAGELQTQIHCIRT